MSKKKKKKRIHKRFVNPKANASVAKASSSSSSIEQLGENGSLRHGRPVQIATALASLVAGLMLLINLDRVTNSSAARELDAGTSLHGWPLVYLKRNFETLPDALVNKGVSSWPFWLAEGEVKTVNYGNLGLDVVCGLVIVMISFFIVWAVVSRYENWKNSW